MVPEWAISLVLIKSFWRLFNLTTAFGIFTLERDVNLPDELLRPPVPHGGGGVLLEALRAVADAPLVQVHDAVVADAAHCFSY